MSKPSKKMLAMQVRQLMPESWSYTQKYNFLSELADEYRIKSIKDVYQDGKSNSKKTEDYSPVQTKADGKG